MFVLFTAQWSRGGHDHPDTMNVHAKVRTGPVLKAGAISRLRMTAAILPATYSSKVTNKAAASGDGVHRKRLYIAMRWAIAPPPTYR
jgi:hypothetical protein